MRGGCEGFKAALAGLSSAVESGEGKSNAVHYAERARRYSVTRCMVCRRWRENKPVMPLGSLVAQMLWWHVLSPSLENIIFASWC